MSNKTKTIQKRDGEKARAKVKQDMETILSKAAQKHIPEGIEDPTLDIKAQRHLVQKVKNRVAAQKARDEKKQYVNELEEIKQKLEEQTRLLNEKNYFLMGRVQQLESVQKYLVAENMELRKHGPEYVSRSQYGSMEMPIVNTQSGGSENFITPRQQNYGMY